MVTRLGPTEVAVIVTAQLAPAVGPAPGGAVV
jgi:hypothetical protein